MTEPYGYSEPQGFDSVRSAVDSEINNNRKTDAQQSEDIEKESQINEEQAQQIETAQQTADEAKSTADEAKAAADEAKETADAAQEAADEANAAIEVLNGDGEGSVNKTVADAINAVIDGAPDTFDTFKEIADYIAEHGEEAAAMTTAIQENKEAIEQNAEAIAQNAEAIGQNSDAIRANIQGIQANAENIATEKAAREELDTKVEEYKQELDAADADLANADRAHDASISAHEGRLLSLEDKMGVAEGDIQGLKDKDAELEAAITEKVAQSDYDAKVAELEAKDAEIEAAVGTKVAQEEYNIKVAEIEAAIAESATKEEVAEAVLPYFDGAEYVSADKKIVFKHGGTVKAEIDATDFIKDGMVSEVKVENGNLVITFNTESGAEPIELPIAEIFNADNYYTKQEVDAFVGGLNEKDAAQDAEIATKVEKVMNGANGKALIFNESDGGGAKFEHADGTWSFAGVNDGGENGIAGQVYAVKKNANGKMEGTRIDVTKGAMYYTVGDAAASERLVAENEIAVKGDITATVEEMVGNTDTLNDISNAAVVDGDDIILSGGEF